MKTRYIILIVIAVGLAFIACQSAEMTAAKVYIQQENYPAALEQLKTAARNEPGNAEVFLMMGKLYAEMDSVQAMNQAFSTALELDSTMAGDINDWQLDKRVEYFNKGIKYGENNKWEKALEATQTAVNIDTTFVDGWANLAYFYTQLDDTAAAFDAYRMANKLDPTNIEYAKTLAVHEFNTGNSEEAANILGKVIEEGEPDVSVYLLQGRILTQQGKIEEAEKIFLEAKEKYPNNTDVLFDYATLLFTKKEYEQAANYFQQAFDTDPNNMDALYNLTVALYKAEKFEESAAKGEELVANDPQNMLGWVQFAISLKRMGNTAKGRAAENVAAALELMEENDYSAAIDLLEPVTKDFPKWCAPWAVLKIAYNELDNAEGVQKAQAGLDNCGE